MALNYDHRGVSFPYTNPSTVAIASGDVIELADCVGVALTDIAGGEDGTVSLDGILEQGVKATGQAWGVGEKVYWSGTAFTTTASGNPAGGTALEVAASADASVRIWIHPM